MTTPAARSSPFERFRSGLDALRLALEARDWPAAERLSTEVEALTSQSLQLPPEQWRELWALHAACTRAMEAARTDLEGLRRTADTAQRARAAYGSDR